MAAFKTQLEAYASANGLLAPWRCLNYVDPNQDPFASYGAENIALFKGCLS
jgi:hypothetical protein